MIQRDRLVNDFEAMSQFTAPVKALIALLSPMQTGQAANIL